MSDSPTLRASLKELVLALTSRLDRVTEPHILFPAIAILFLAVIWGATLNLINVERVAAERTAASTSQSLAETYEAQVVRAMREIDQTLKVVKYAYELKGEPAVLQELKKRALLPPPGFFVVSIADRKGDIVFSTRMREFSNVADQEYFQIQRLSDRFSVSYPQKNLASGEWTLQFSRRLESAGGVFSGIVMISVDAAYFVSAYGTSNLGEHGVLGILGADGVFRATRSGEVVSAGDIVDYATVVPATDEAQSVATLSTNTWDGVLRYTSARQLYEFPVAVVVGLSEDEQLVATRKNKSVYLWRAAAASLLLILILGFLGRISRQLASSRLRAVEAQVDHAARVEYLAYHDSLTTLPNRSLFSKLLGQSISQAHRYNRQLAVLFLDLDHFKHINDTLGHEAGDQLLQEVAIRLKACLRDSDTVARLGGDEFVVLLPEFDEEMYAAIVARKILSAVARPFILHGEEFRVTASIGISSYPQDGLDEQTLTKNADIAMYHAKENGKNNFQFYSTSLNSNSFQRLALESGLRHAIEKNEFQLNYQSRRDIRSNDITGMQAQLLWQHPNLGMVAPQQFMPVAEETGLIMLIGKWVLRSACLQNVAWQNQDLPRLRMTVKLTPRQFFDENLLVDLTWVLSDTGMEAHLLELEITESMLLCDVEKALPVLTGLKAMGIRIAIDHFGLGYFLLAKFNQFPLDTIKIDRHFIRNLVSLNEDQDQDQDQDLVQAIMTMGRTLSLNVVAQDVETKEQADFLRHNAYGKIQGFYLNESVPADQIAELLRAQLEIE